MKKIFYLTLTLTLLPITQPQAQSQEDKDRIVKMSKLLDGSEKNAYEEYKKICDLSTTQPKINMTILESRATSWCFPERRSKTTTSSGEFVQEIYSRNRYLYFTNGILTSIQE